MIIIEMGSGDTCKNDEYQIRAMIDAVPVRYDVVLKWQLFSGDTLGPYNVPHLEAGAFAQAYHYAKSKGFKTTASVFDKQALDFLLKFDVPFVKIACQTKKYKFRNSTYDLIDFIPRGMQVVVSCESEKAFKLNEISLNSKALCCIPQYPANYLEYTNTFSKKALSLGISDHSPLGIGLYKDFRPRIYEKHFCLSWQTSLDKEWSLDENTIKELFEI